MAGEQRFAWELGAIKEIVPTPVVTRLPGAPAWVLGLLNLRGRVVTVVDLAVRMGLPSGVGASIVVLELDGRMLGVRVDEVRSVANAEDATVEPVEAARAADGLVAGMVRLTEGTASLVDARAFARSVLVTA
ncbi:MAG: chemotaxis protein CheW [Gemmatimonadetes bacterium]|nr:chemotaxis protein CheW [Gemmatimonadota bacterium]